MARSMQACLSCGVVLTALTSPLGAADWPQFRGPNAAGVAVSPAPPVEFAPGRNELWRAAVGAGHSSPCIVGDDVLLTACDVAAKRLSVLCLERATGATRWQWHVDVDELETGHPSFHPASSTPASDGRHVVAYFGSYGLVGLTRDGQLAWEVRMPLAKSYAGNAASPILAGDRAILYRATYVDHFLLAVDKATGQELWRVPQEERFTGEMACTACPIVAGDKLIVHSARAVQAFELATGAQAWTVKCATTATSTPVLAGDEVLVAAWNKMGEPALRPPLPSFEQLIAEHDDDRDGALASGEWPVMWIFHRPEGIEAPDNGATVRFALADKDKDGRVTAAEWSTACDEIERFRAGYDAHGLLAIPLESTGLVAADRVRTLERQGISEVPSPVFDGQYVYFVNNGGLLTCLEVATGRRVYRTRTGGRGTHYASPVIADGKIYTTAGNGQISVLTLGPEPQRLALNDLGEEVYATPAIVDGALYVRTHSTLFAFGAR